MVPPYLAGEKIAAVPLEGTNFSWSISDGSMVFSALTRCSPFWSLSGASSHTVTFQQCMSIWAIGDTHADSRCGETPLTDLRSRPI
jgi:hypothetical protein